jgi:hypothetical protein
MFTPLTRYALATHEGEYRDWPLTTPLLIDGVESAYRVPGFVIEAQYQWGDHVLLITSWDCLFEEAYEFLLLDHTHRIVSHKHFGAPYTTYLLDAHWPIDDVSIRLHFQRRLFVTLTIRPPLWLFRRAHTLRVTRHLVTPDDERSQASIRRLEETLASITAAAASDR